MNSEAAATNGINSGRTNSVRTGGQACALAQSEREQQRERQAGDDGASGIHNVVANCGREMRIGKQARVIVEAPVGSAPEGANDERAETTCRTGQ